MHKIILFTILSIILSACGSVPPAAGQLPVGTQIIPQPSAASTVLPTPASGGGLPAGALAARDDLAARLNLPLDQVQVTTITPRDFPDSCLGISAADIVCMQVVTPGYEIVLVADALQYTYHSDVVGRNIRSVPEPTPVAAQGGEQNQTILEWTSPDCDVLSVTNQAVLLGKCGQELKVVPASDQGQETYKKWQMTFASFEADTHAGKIKFTGAGTRTDGSQAIVASPAEQRMMAEWARLQFESAQSGRTGAAWGLAIGYHREGGFAGFCDDVAVYLDGRAMVSSCKGINTNLYLSASELQQVYDWFDGFKTIDYSSADPGVADSMKIGLAMPGQGTQSADTSAIQAILEFASRLEARASFNTQAPAQLAQAEQTLRDYFKALNTGDYSLAAKLYGGPTDLLQTWNPDIKDNLPAWLENGCKNNGLVCMLPRSMRYEGPDAHGSYQFMVEFNNPDGTIFVQGPCCGETSGTHTSSFPFTVTQSGSNWQVIELPPYVP